MPGRATPFPVLQPTRERRIPRAATIVLGSLIGLLVASSASAWVPTPNRPRMTPPAKSTARYIPGGAPHADPITGRLPLVAVLARGPQARVGVVLTSRVGRASVEDGLTGAERSGWPGRAGPPLVSTLPSHWGATHLSI